MVARSSSGEILQRLRGHAEEVFYLAFAGGSEKIVSGSQDGNAMIWEWETSETAVRVLEGHGEGVSSFAVSSDGGRVFSCADDGTLRTWDVSAGTETEETSLGNAVDCVAFCGENGMIALGLKDGTLRVLDCETKHVLFQDIESHEVRICCVSFSPNGSHVAAGSQDTTICVWNIRTWTRVGDSFKGHDARVHSVAFSPDGKRIASGSNDCSIRLWDIDSGACVGISKISSWVYSVSFIGDGERLVSGSDDGIVRIWDARLQTEANEEEDGHSGLGGRRWQSVEMGRGWLPHQATEPCDCGMHRLGTRSGHHGRSL